MTHDEYIALDKEYIMNTYGRFPLVADHGEGAVIWDADGKRYIDFGAGIGTSSLGYNNKLWVEKVTCQLSKIQHISNYYISQPTALLAKELITRSGFAKKVFFGNSGAEANEGAIKTARKYAIDKGRGSDIITFNKSFHGRTVTTLAATGQDVFHHDFFPFTEGFRYAEYNNIDSVKAMLDDEVCAVMCEPIQGEGGVNVADRAFIEELYKICRDRDILLVFDEVQTGMGRTGKLFAWQHFDVIPDIVTLAKGIAGGLPMGAFLVGEKAENTLGTGKHGSTFGGNPVSASGALAVLETLTDDFLCEVEKKGAYIKEKILAMKKSTVTEVKGKGLMIGIDTTLSNKEVAKKCFESGLLALTAGERTVRLLPPLVITYDEIDEGLAILEKIL